MSVIALRQGTPPAGVLFPGIVTPYRETRLSFEVAGRIVELANVGDDVEGEKVDREGVVTAPGTVVARLDAAPYERAVKQVMRRLDSAQAQLDALEVQLDQVLPARLASARSRAEAAELSVSYARDDVSSAESAVDLAKTTLQRNRELLQTNAVSDIAVRQSETDLNAQEARLAQTRTLVTTRSKELDAATSSVAEAEGAIALQRATVAAQVASIEELEQQLLDARSSLENCVLRAPFGGRITAVEVGEGSVVQAGSPVALLTMMTPIEVQLTLSAAIEEELVVGSDGMVYPMNGNEIEMGQGIRATLFEKRGVANEGTRTFTVGLIAPNKRRALRPELDGLPSTPYLMPVFRNPLDVSGDTALYTVDEAVGGSTDDAYVLKVQGVRQGERSAESLKGELQSIKVPVRIGDDAIKIASFSLVQLLTDGAIDEADLLVAFPTPAHEGRFVVSDNRWMLRPGDLVQVSMGRSELASGFYVPVQAIQEINGATAVFVVSQDGGQGARARRVEIQASESVGELRRIEAEGLKEGEAIVMQGAHFLQDGDAVTVVERLEAAVR
ncbi:MAG: HlyD family efflux transporter periplasmic adaptor subunit [Planctomycetota bacterium]